MSYTHTQKAPLQLLLLGGAAVLAILAGLAQARAADRLGLLIAAGVVTLVAFCFGTLTVRDAGQTLVVRFGPLPLFGTTIRYADMRGVEAARSSFLDGWGVHYVPGRGWIYNLWGYDCVRVRLANRSIRIGTDDVAGLVEFLRTKLPR